MGQAEQARSGHGSEQRKVPPPGKPTSSRQKSVPQPTVQPKQQVDDDGFIEVTKKKFSNRKRLVVTGASSSTLLRGVAAPPRKSDLFVGRLDPSTTSEAVESHVNWLLGGADKASVTEIPHCAEAYGYKGFKVTVPVEDVYLVLLPDKWPMHVSIKKFYQPRGSRDMTKPQRGARFQDKQLIRSVSVGHVGV